MLSENIVKSYLRINNKIQYKNNESIRVGFKTVIVL